MNKYLNKIFSARFLVTIFLTLSFCHLTYVGKVAAEVFVPVFIVVLQYYFNRKRKEPNEEIINPN